MVASYIKIATKLQPFCMYNRLYKHVHAELRGIVFARSQVQASMVPIDSTRNLQQPAARLSKERALFVDILRPLYDSRCIRYNAIRLIYHVIFVRRMSER